MPATMTFAVVQGRWGWHAVDYPTFLKIKDFHKLLLRDYRATRRWTRWHAKEPQNRIHRNRLTGVVTPISEPTASLGTNKKFYQWILAEYRSVRQPRANPESVPLLDLPSDWEVRLAKLQEFYGSA